MISAGAIVTGQVTNSIVSPEVVIEKGAVVEGSVLHEGVRIGSGAVVRRAILDKNVVVPPEGHIGVDPEHDGSTTR